MARNKVDEPITPNEECILETFKEPLWDSNKRFIVLNGGGGSGKAVPGSTRVITPDGYKLMRDIKVGDVICNTHGGETRVLEKYHPPTTQMYMIVFEDGRKTVACKDHLWSCKVSRHALSKGFDTTLTTEILAKALPYVKNISIPIADPVYHVKKRKLIEPYLLGLILGDTSCDFNGGILPSAKYNEVDVWLRGHLFTEYLNPFKINIPTICKKHLEKYCADVRLKSIPEECLLSSKNDRLELLRGLLDAGATVNRRGQITFTAYSPQLARGVAQLVRSLGGVAKMIRISEDDWGFYSYKVHIRFKDTTTDVFRVNSKQKRVKVHDGSKDKGLKIESISPIVYDGDIYCIKVDAEDSLYLIDDYIVTHNSRSICQRLCYLFMHYDDIIIAVIRESMPILKRSVYMGDPSIIRTLRSWNVPVDDWWNKTDGIITNPANNSEFRFIGLDSAEKIKSQNWNYCWIEEATELSLEKWMQCDTRMRRPNKHGPDQMFISYNPISIYNWVLQLFVANPSEYITENSLVHFSNFLDNPFLPKDAIISMFDKAEKDENYYWTYVVGKAGIPVGQIYTNITFSYRDGVYNDGGEDGAIEIQAPWPEEVWKQKPYFAIDWGWVDPTVIVEFREYDGKVYVICRYYESERTMSQIKDALKEIGCDGDSMIYCDSAEKDRINELSLAGFCPIGATKSIHAGIMHVRSLDIVLDITGKYGAIAKEEVDSYSWKKDKDDPRILLDEPDDSTPDHFCLDEDTLITTKRGNIPIKDVVVGDYVLTRDGYKEVLDAMLTNESAEVMKITTEDGRELIATPNHKIFTFDDDAFTYASDLRVGSKLYCIEDKDVVVDVCMMSGRRRTYNLTVKDVHEYFANDILVSNCDCLRYGPVTQHLHSTEFSTGVLMSGDVPTSQRKKTSKEILEDMRKCTSSF